MRGLALLCACAAVSAGAQVTAIKDDAPPPGGAQLTNIFLQGTDGRIVVPAHVLHDFAEAEPDIVAPDGAPREGIVLLAVTVSETGEVTEAIARVGDEALRAAAVDGVKAEWRYRPLMVNGVPQRFLSYISLQFHDGVGKRSVAAMAGMAGPGQPPLISGAMRVSGGVMAGLIVHSVPPVYPPIARAAHVQGAVILSAVISKTGDIENLQVVSGPPMLVGAARDAVQKWRYKPYLLNGEPMEVQTTVTVNFQFADPPAASAPDTLP